MSVARTPEVPLSALVLTAGLGTRLEPLTYVRAKAAVPVNGETLARRVIRWLTSFGIGDFVLNLHHLPASIAASVGDGSDLNAVLARKNPDSISIQHRHRVRESKPYAPF